MWRMQKYQWDLIHDPQNMLFAWAQDEEEGASVIDKPGKVRAITELVRYAYACDKSIKIKTGTPSTSNITLGDDHEYGYIGIYIKEDATISNLKNSIQTDIPPRTWDGNEKKRIGFSNNSIEFITLTEDKSKLESYLTSSQNREIYLASIDKWISNWETHYYDLNALPSAALKDLTNTQRINLLTKMTNLDIRNVDGLAARVMINVPNEDINDFFEKLKQTTLFYTFKQQMNHDNYTELIKSATLLYYQQDMLKEKLKNITPDKMFVHQYRKGSIGASITNDFFATKNKFIITGNVVVVSRSVGSETSFEAYNQQSNQTTSFQAYTNTVDYFDLVGVELHSDLGNIKANGKVVPMPAFYFDWLYTNQKRENTIKAIDASITILSLAVGVGELRAVAAAGRFIFIARTTAGILRSSVNLVLLDDKIRDKIKYETESGGAFLIWWDKLWWVYDIATFDLKTISKNRDFFNDFVIAWNGTKEVLKSQLDSELLEEIQVFIDEIEQNK